MGGIILLKKFLTALIIVSILTFATGCQNENLQSQNSLITNDELSKLQEASIKQTELINELIIQNKDLKQSIIDISEAIAHLEQELEEINRNTAPSVIQNETQNISDEEVKTIYQNALEIYYWFQVWTMNLDLNQSEIIDNTTYYKSTEFSSYQEFLNHMKSVLDSRIVEELLSTNRYIDIEGHLYGVLADRGTDLSKGEETFEIIRINENTILYKVVVEILDNNGKVTGYETHEFHLKYYTDGKWRFETFYLFR